MDELESRLDRIETVLGTKEKIENESALQRFARLESQMEALLKAKPSLVEHLSKLKQLRDLENDVAFNDITGQSHAAKLSILFASREDILNTTKLLEEINENKKFVNEKSYTDLTETESKLKPLESVFLKQRRECFKQTNELDEILQKYNLLIQSISQQFYVWDEQITAVEQQFKRNKK